MTTALEQKKHIALKAHHEAIRAMTMSEALDFVAERQPNQLALEEVEHLRRRMSWGQFREQVDRLRSGLERAGLKPGERVGLLLKNQIEFPVAWFAVIGAGCAIVPLNPKYTTRELDFVLADAGATWLIGLGELIDQHVTDGSVGDISAERMVALGSSNSSHLEYEALLASPVTERTHKPETSEIVNVQFTSGTTGLPKGCLLTHEYWIELGVLGSASYGDPQRFLADHPFYYMQNQAYFMMTLASGGAMYVTPGLSRRKFMGWLHDYEIDFAWVDEDMLEFQPSDLDSQLALKHAPVSGMPGEAYAPLKERFGIDARESYASTEVGSAIGVPLARADLAGTGTMGYCLPNRESKVIDEQLNEVAPGTPGELCLRGKGIMLGYHNRPEANAELFLPGGWFRTGDLVMKNTDGLHYFVGRLKDIIRRSGENISALEVEMHLANLEGVRDVAVIPVPDPQREEEVKAVIVRSNASLTVDDVIRWAGEGLAPFKIPRYVEFREELPYTGSGKVAKGTLKNEPPIHAGVFDTAERNQH